MPTRWRITFELIIDDGWRDEGFLLTPEMLTEVLQAGILYYAHDSEKHVEKVQIREVQTR